MLEFLSSKTKFTTINRDNLNSQFNNMSEDEEIEIVAEQIVELIKSKGVPNKAKSDI